MTVELRPMLPLLLTLINPTTGDVIIITEYIMFIMTKIDVLDERSSLFIKTSVVIIIVMVIESCRPVSRVDSIILNAA